MSASDFSMLVLTAALVVVGIYQGIIYSLQWKAMRVSSERGLRAYVSIMHDDPDEPQRTPESTFQFFYLKVKNCGQTPAYDVQSSFGWISLQGKDAPWPNKEPMPTDIKNCGSLFTLGSGCEVIMKTDLNTLNDAKLFYERLWEADHDRITIYYCGRVTYRDIFQQEHFTDYCLMHVHGTTPANARVCNHHNESN